MSLNELLDTHQFKALDVEEWAKTNYPQFLHNNTLITKLFLLSHGVKIAPPVRRSNLPVTKIANLEHSKASAIEGVIIQEVQSRSYMGCSKCMKKIDTELGIGATCGNCNEGKAEELVWRSYLVGDDSGEIIATAAPSIKEVLHSGMLFRGQGKTKDDLTEITIFQLDVQPAVKKPQETAPTSQPDVSTQSTPPEPPKDGQTELPFKCPHCTTSFSLERIMKSHMTRSHKDKMETSSSSTPTESTSVAPEANTTLSTEEVTKPTTEETSTSSPPTDPSPEAVRTLKVMGMLHKPEDEARKVISEKFPGSDFNAIATALGVEIVDGKLQPPK